MLEISCNEADEWVSSVYKQWNLSENNIENVEVRFK
jgi:hypothetical protein